MFLRTCYAPRLDSAYQSLANRCVIADSYGVDPDMVLDDAELYEFGNSWDRILTRIPMLPDVNQWSTEEDYLVSESLGSHGDNEDDDEIQLQRASEITVMVLYVIDEEAIYEDLVKIKWLGSHGQCVWENKIAPASLADFRGSLMGGTQPAEAVESYGSGENPTARNAILVL